MTFFIDFPQLQKKLIIKTSDVDVTEMTKLSALGVFPIKISKTGPEKSAIMKSGMISIFDTSNAPLYFYTSLEAQ